MSIPRGIMTSAGATAMLLLLGGCVSHDQVHLHNPSPCRVRCHADYVAPLNPECHGYHPTCWLPWSCNCPPCPPPEVAVGPPGLDVNSLPMQFEVVPEEVKPPSQQLPQNEEVPPPDFSSENGRVSDLVPKVKNRPRSTLKIVHHDTNDDAPKPPDPPK